MLRNGDLDIVYTLNPLMESEEMKMLYHRKETLGFYASPDNPLSSAKSVRERDLEGEMLLLTSHNCSFKAMLTEALERENVKANIALETTNKTILKQFAQNGLGIAFIPDMVAEAERREGSLTRLRWKGSDFPIYSQVFVHKDKHLSQAIQTMVETIQRYAEV